MPFDLSRILRWCVPLTVAYMVASVLIGVLAALEAWGGLVLLDPASPVMSEVEIVYGVISLAVFVVLAATYVVNAIWVYRASANARALDPWEGRIRPGWAVGWFAVPIANLWLPYRGLREIWTSTMAPGSGSGGDRPGYLAWLWGFWVVSSTMSGISMRMATTGTIEDYQSSLILDVVATPLDVAGAALFLRFLREVSSAQRAQVAAPEIFD